MRTAAEEAQALIGRTTEAEVERPTSGRTIAKEQEVGEPAAAEAEVAAEDEVAAAGAGVGAAVAVAVA